MTVIFGGGGFIGCHLATELAAGGGKVVLADLEPPRRAVPESVSFVRCDVREPIGALEGAEPDLVVNLAAVHRTPGHEDHEYHETNENGARNVTAYCEQHGVERLWFTSSIAVYGPGEDPKDEDSALTPVSAYGKSKVRAEEIHREWATRGDGRRLVVVRPATVFGPGEGGNFTRLAKSLRTRTFLYPGRRTTRKACGYVDDLVGSLGYMEQFADPVVTYNFGYPTPPTTEEIVEAFRRVGGFSRPLGTVPLGPILAVAKGLHRAGLKTFDPSRVVKLVHSTNIVPKQLVEREYAYRTNLDTALERWYREDPVGSFV